MADDSKTSAQDGFAYVEYKEACSAYFHGVEIGYTVVKHYATVNALLIASLYAIGTLDLKNPVLPLPVYIAACIPVFAILLSILLALAVPHYWQHMENCASRCNELEEQYGGKLFAKITATGKSSKFETGVGLRAVVLIVGIIWVMLGVYEFYTLIKGRR